MRSALRLLTLSAIAVAGAACGPRIEVRTMTAPDAGFAGMHTFRVLPVPVRRGSGPVSSENDPMVASSIANRALREQIVQGFTSRGYAQDEKSADFAIAFYATAREKLDVSEWDYGYPFSAGWGAPNGMSASTTTYAEGSLVVDVLRSNDRVLLWRGEGRAQLTDDPSENVARLGNAARTIIAKFPSSTIVNVVAVR